MDEQTKRLFQILFQEAHVVDVDFSNWDKYVRLVVVGGLCQGNFDGRGPIHNIDFIQIAELTWRSTAPELVLADADQHVQWVVMDFQIIQAAGNLEISLISVAPPCPELFIKCKNVLISEVRSDLIERVNPNWNRPYCSLARPGLEELAGIMSRKK